MTRRTYRSPLRAEQAAASRAAVLKAARQLFVERGYGATTVDDIAQLAGVSKPTVFAAVGNKAAVLKTVRDVALAGDDEARSAPERDSVTAVATAPDLHAAIAATAVHISGVAERYHDVYEVVRGAVGLEPAVAELWEAEKAERHVGAGHLVTRLVGHGRLAVPRREAVDRVWLLMAPDAYLGLVIERGWSRAAYRAWLVDELTALF